MARVKVDGVGVVEFPDSVPPEQMSAHINTLLSQRQSTPIADIIPKDAGLRARTLTDRLRDAKDAIGRIIAPLAGLDFDEMADDEAHGILRQMIAFTGKSPLKPEKAAVKPASSPLRLKLEQAVKELEAVTPRAEFGERYPASGEPVLNVDAKTGKQFLGKGPSPESTAVQKVRQASQALIDAGEYDPYFNVSERYHADPVNYPLEEKTIEKIRPKKAATEEAYKLKANSKEAEKRLLAAYKAAKSDTLAHDWYAMGQLEEEYVRELGPVEGRKAFKRNFADAMAATTGGADPKSNFIMAHYGNYLRQAGVKIPEESYKLPFPIGGRYAGGNMAMYDRVINEGEGLAVTNPKRHNFSANFQGYADPVTIDEQMSKGFDPSMMSPPTGSYGVYESSIGRLAKKAKTTPRNFQEVAWAGLKGSKGKPMIQEINEAIERTHHITGMQRDEIVKRMVRGLTPMFGIAGAAYLGSEPAEPEIPNAQRIAPRGLTSMTQ